MLYVGKHYMLGSFILSDVIRSDVIRSVFIRSDVIRSDVIRSVIIRSVGESTGSVGLRVQVHNIFLERHSYPSGMDQNNFY